MFDTAEAMRMCIFLASSLAWMPTLVALDHPDDDHLHVVCAPDDGTPSADVSPYRVLRSLIFRHDGQTLKLHVGEHAQMLVSDELGYECKVWAKVVIKKVWAEGFAVVTICSECRDVIAPKVSVPHSLPALLRCSCLTFKSAAFIAQRLHGAHAPRSVILVAGVICWPLGS